MKNKEYIKIWMSKPYVSNGEWTASVTSYPPSGTLHYPYAFRIAVPEELLPEDLGEAESL